MGVRPAPWWWMLAACAVLIVGVAFAVALGVIPPVGAAAGPIISPNAVPAFWTAVGLHLLVALVLLLVMTLSKCRSAVSTSVLMVAGVVGLFLGFVLSDAALAFGEMGPTVKPVTLVLFLCVAADAVGGALTITAAVLRPKGGPSPRARSEGDRT